MKNKLIFFFALTALLLYLPVRVHTVEKTTVVEVQPNRTFKETINHSKAIVIPVMRNVHGHGFEACSSVRIDVNTILTAGHCFDKGAPYVGQVFYYGTQLATVEAFVLDDKDHVAIKINRTFPNWARFSKRPTEKGDVVSILGNPAGMPDVFRVGYIAGHNSGWTMMDINIAGGDSGSGVFNSQGKLIGTVEVVSNRPLSHLGGFRPYNFDKDKLKAAGITFHY